MTHSSSGSVTDLLKAWQEGDRAALDQLMPLVITELRRIAGRYVRRESPGNTLQPTDLVNEAYLRLVDQRSAQWRHRAHFLAIAAEMMRRILVDHAREKKAQKRGGAVQTVVLDEAIDKAPSQDVDVVRLDDALKTLADLDSRQGRIVEFRFFGGMTVEETAEVVGISPATVKREWAMAKAWLYHELSDG